ncbi:MAG: sigma 54-interacting transcriptional regulator [Bradymonadia bacterium]
MIDDPRNIYTQQVDISHWLDQIEVEQCRLVVVEGPDVGRQLTVDKPIVRIGSNEKNDLVLGDNTVSRFHCEIRRVRDEYLFIDRQSTNGCYMGDLRLVEGYLYPNCEILIGSSLVRFEPLVESIEIVPSEEGQYGDLIGSSHKMRKIYGLLDKVAPSELSVVIQGQTGTGKELVSRAIHQFSRRKSGPLVIFDCSAFPENLLESELFGHEKGAFSGAVRTHRGVFERAEGGTIFFDELGEMSVNLQPKFLRALESGEIRRVGGERTIKIDARVVSATNRNLLSMVEEGTFRQDLYYRLAKVTLELPPLRERLDDLPRLCEHFINQLKSRGSTPSHVRGFSAEALNVMSAYDWPGNIRELRNVVERAAAFCEGDLIQPDDLPSDLCARLGMEQSNVAVQRPAVTPGLGLKEAKEMMVSNFERDYLAGLLKQYNMNISRVAREAGIDRRHVYRLMKKYDLEETSDS